MIPFIAGIALAIAITGIVTASHGELHFQRDTMAIGWGLFVVGIVGALVAALIGAAP